MEGLACTSALLTAVAPVPGSPVAPPLFGLAGMQRVGPHHRSLTAPAAAPCSALAW